MEKFVEVITGPTASGKTSLALERAEGDARVEILNADAFQIYKGFDIGTAKPSLEIRAKIPHHLIDILEPQEKFSVADYSTQARSIVKDIIAQDKTPIVVGGTGFYIDALFYGLSTVEIPSQILEEARARYQEEFKVHGFEKMFSKLFDVDPRLYKQIEREHNPIRLERAWSHYYATGIPLGVARETKPEPFEYKPVFTVLDVQREELNRRIEQRVDEMLSHGWLDEVRGLLANGVTPDMPAMRAIGYTELARVAEGNAGLSDMREKIVIRTRQYAKRQITWMKRYKK
jgi:tRNA dimethylallyltransferase